MKPPKRAPSKRAKPRVHRADGATTRQKIYDVALKLFRERGFDSTTMRMIAKRARVSLGLAYHYFASKEAIVLAFYEASQVQYSRVALRRLREATTLRERVYVALATKIELLRDDKDLVVALTRVVIDPTSPLGAFSPETEAVRREAVRVLVEAVTHPDAPTELRDVLATTLFALQMGALLYFVHDESKGNARTMSLIAHAADLGASLAPLLGYPFLAPMREDVLRRLGELGLVMHAPLSASPAESAPTV